MFLDDSAVSQAVQQISPGVLVLEYHDDSFRLRVVIGAEEYPGTVYEQKILPGYRKMAIGCYRDYIVIYFLLRLTAVTWEFVFSEENPTKAHPKIFYSTFCGSRMFLFSVSPLSRNL